MKIFNHSLFPTAVTYIEDFLTSDQVRDIFAYILTNPQQIKIHPALTNNSVSSHNYSPTEKDNFLHNISCNVISCRNIEEDIFNHTVEYGKRYNIQISKIESAWYNIQNIGSNLVPHKHAGSTISGALYINVDNDSSAIYFDNPNPFINFFPINSQSENDTVFSYLQYFFKPRSGDMILFPSWLTHHSNNISNQTELRTVVSFNAL